MPATPACAVSPLSPAMSAASGASRGHRHKPILAERFKTKMCRTFVETGSCPYEERCMFAHGDADLRSKEMNLADNLTTEEAIRSFQRSLRGDSSSDDQATEMSPTTTTPMVPTMLAPLPTKEDAAPCSPASTAPPTPQVPVAKGLRFVAALCAPALDPAMLEEAMSSPTQPKETPIKSTYAAEDRASSPSSAGPASALRKQVSEFSDYVAPTLFAIPLPRSQSPAAGSTATSPSASPSKRGYRHDPYAPVVLSPQASAPGSRVASPQASPQTVALPFPEFFAPSPMPCLCVDCLVASGAVTPVVSPASARAQSPSVAMFAPPRVSTMNPRASTYCPPPKSTYCAAAMDTRHDVLLA